MRTIVYHPRRKDCGAQVKLDRPSTASTLDTWEQLNAVACVTPDGPMPKQINGVSAAPWRGAPDTETGWVDLAGATAFHEPAFKPRPGLKRAAGVVIEEADGRVWLVSPSNAFGGYQATFPKGTVEGNLSLKATAVREAFEETGLRVKLDAHLLDVVRTTSVTRYYRATRLGGDPSAMCWETQAVHLAPRSALPALLTHPSDRPLLALLMGTAAGCAPSR